MATSKILYLNNSENKFKGKRLKQAIEYITDPTKTQDGRYVGAVNCLIDRAYEDMVATKKRFDKTDKRQGYHLIISFKEGETDPDTVFEIVGRFVQEYLSKNYEAIYTIHDNTDHIHGHIVFNSVRFTDGKKYRYKKGDWMRYIQPLLNRLCEEYEMSVIDLSKDKSETAQLDRIWKDIKSGPSTWSEMIRRDMDLCIIKAGSFSEFLLLLKESGYELKQGKYLSVRPPGMDRFRRCKTLGENYTEDRIRERILCETEKTCKVESFEDAEKVVYGYIPGGKRARLTPLQKKYYSRLYQIGLLKRRPYSKAWMYKDEIKKMHTLQEQYLFLIKHEIEDVEHLKEIQKELSKKKVDVTTEKKQLNGIKNKHMELFEIADAMNDLVEAEMEFRNGDEFFWEEHDKWSTYESLLNQQGFTFEEIVELKSQLKNDSLRLAELERELKKKIKTAESIRKDLEEEKSLDKKKEYEHEKKQPTR